eukprot:scaffold31311_cov64-Phaeocystis_antarctica.AAC.4
MQHAYFNIWIYLLTTTNLNTRETHSGRAQCVPNETRNGPWHVTIEESGTARLPECFLECAPRGAALRSRRGRRTGDGVAHRPRTHAVSNAAGQALPASRAADRALQPCRTRRCRPGR